MAGVLLDGGLNAILNAAFSSSLPQFATGRLRLYKNNVTPSNANVLADFTEATFAGYASQVYTAANWPTAAAVAHVSTTSASVKTFTITSGTQDIYGWYFTDSGGTVLLAAQRDPNAPVTLDAAAVNSYSVIVTMQGKDIATP